MCTLILLAILVVFVDIEPDGLLVSLLLVRFALVVHYLVIFLLIMVAGMVTSMATAVVAGKILFLTVATVVVAGMILFLTVVTAVVAGTILFLISVMGAAVMVIILITPPALVDILVEMPPEVLLEPPLDVVAPLAQVADDSMGVVLAFVLHLLNIRLLVHPISPVTGFLILPLGHVAGLLVFPISPISLLILPLSPVIGLLVLPFGPFGLLELPVYML